MMNAAIKAAVKRAIAIWWLDLHAKRDSKKNNLTHASSLNGKISQDLKMIATHCKTTIRSHTSKMIKKTVKVIHRTGSPEDIDQ